MSMHEIEGAVEYAIRHLATSDYEDKRSAYAALYRYPEQHDCGYTHFRVLQELLSARYLYERTATDHPQYEAIASALESLGESGFVLADPSGEYDPRKNPEAGFYREGNLYFDAGSPMWQAFVDAGLLTGPDAERPRPVDILDVVAEVASLAESAGDAATVASWYPLIELELVEIEDVYDPSSVELLAENESVARIRDAAIRMEILKDLDYGGALLPEEILAESPVLAWWYDLKSE